MKIFVIKDEGVVYRVRKEEHGCSVFTPKRYIEGNETLFEILQLISEKGVEGGIGELESRYPGEKHQIRNDLDELAAFLLEKGVVPGICRQIIDICGTGSQAT